MTALSFRTRLLAGAGFVAGLTLAAPALAQHHGDHAGHAMPAPSTEAQPPAPAQDAPPADPHAGHAMDDDNWVESPVGFARPMSSPLGRYSMNRDAGATGWQPDASPMFGVMKHSGDWMLMGHVLLNGVYVDQGGPRGGSKAFAAGMLMGMAQRQVGPGMLGFKAMVSPDPFMGKSGYPLLLATGETADGEHPLIDRQHPHDLIMEMSASYSLSVGEKSDVYLYAGLPGSPAYGPPAFMHRQASMDSPEAPISHHWFDSTHITFGVVTAGFSHADWKIETSAFRGREPDQKRYDIETGELDSVSARLSYNPTPNWALQTSWAKINSPEALDPDSDEARVSASALYARPLGRDGSVSATLAWSRKDRIPGDALQAWLAEGSVKPNDRWTIFARAEQVEQDELADHHGSHAGEAYTVRRVSLGAIRDFVVAPKVKFGIGGLVSAYDAPEALGYDDPMGGMAFVRLRIG
ncbi:hypothetical protein [Caulobacter endophyticus]|uniref:hypothetical protein n=1 Tax=Caulobacter endophyticus TaxID=2172652 RepID=UPI00240EAB06|nr:hypothetical protein [Caulobacter endophyticus]MDG2530280.1 hypothetical protein [Caulobacter endophyticus]